MDRRSFICRVTATGTAAGLTTANAAGAETREVAYKVKGFTCLTCAVGLEVMLRGLKGVVRVKASYPEAKVVIGFDEKLISGKTLQAFISKCGFAVA